MSAADLTSVADVKAWLGLTVTTDDGILSRLVTSLSAAVQQRINRSIPADTYTETRNGTGQRALMLTNTPLISVASVTVDGVTIPARPSVTGAGYTFDDRCLYLQGYCFTRGQQNVVVSYTGGYVTVPDDLAQATLELVAFSYREKDRIGEAMKVLAAGNVSYLRDFPVHTLAAIDQYKRAIYP